MSKAGLSSNPGNTGMQDSNDESATEQLDDLIAMADYYRPKVQAEFSREGFDDTLEVIYRVDKEEECDVAFPARRSLVWAAYQLLLGRVQLFHRFAPDLGGPEFSIRMNNAPVPERLLSALQQFGQIAHEIGRDLPKDFDVGAALEKTWAMLKTNESSPTLCASESVLTGPQQVPLSTSVQIDPADAIQPALAIPGADIVSEKSKFSPPISQPVRVEQCLDEMDSDHSDANPACDGPTI